MAGGMDASTSGDEELARLAGRGDEAAFAELYHRHFPALYDYALRLSRDREVAALVVQASFLNAYGALSSDEPQSPLKLQLFAAAHGDLPLRLRARRGEAEPVDEPFAATDPSRADPAFADAPVDFASTVWQAAIGMRREDYELLDLSIRHGFDTQEIATVLRTRPESVETRLSSASEAFDSALSAWLLMDIGRRACVDLDFEIGDEEWSEALGRRIARHLEGCQTCQATRQGYPRGSKLLAALTPVPAPEGWEETMLGRLQDAARAGRIPAVVAAKGPSEAPPVALGAIGAGAGLGDWARRNLGGPRGPMLIALGGGMLLVILVVAGLCGAGAFDGGDGDATPTPTTTITATGTVTSTPTTSPTPTETPTGTVEVAPATSTVPAIPTPPPTSTGVPTEAPTETSAPPTEPPASATPVATATAKPTPEPTETDVPATTPP